MQETIRFWKRKQVRAHQRVAMAVCSLKEGDPRTNSNSGGERARVSQPEPRVTLPKQSRQSRAEFSQRAISSGKCMMMRQFQVKPGG